MFQKDFRGLDYEKYSKYCMVHGVWNAVSYIYTTLGFVSKRRHLSAVSKVRLFSQTRKYTSRGENFELPQENSTFFFRINASFFFVNRAYLWLLW